MAAQTLANAHSIVIDEAKLPSKQVAIRIYDAKKTLLLNLLVNTDTNSRSLVTIKNPPPPPARTLVMSVAPPAPSIPDNSPAGTVVATATVQYSDGTVPAVGAITLTSSDPSFIAVRGMQLVLARSLTVGDDGTKQLSITAADAAGAAVKMRLF
jgi:hypothetical protein